MMLTANFKTESRFPVDRKKIREIINQTLDKQGLKNDCEISISIVGDRKMRGLNKKYLNLDETTDVLSFPLESEDKIIKRGTPDAPSGFVSPPDGLLHLGDIVVSYPQALAQAAEKNIFVDQEINILIEHGVLHLLGIHHDE